MRLFPHSWAIEQPPHLQEKLCLFRNALDLKYWYWKEQYIGFGEQLSNFTNSICVFNWGYYYSKADFRAGCFDSGVDAKAQYWHIFIKPLDISTSQELFIYQVLHLSELWEGFEMTSHCSCWSETSHKHVSMLNLKTIWTWPHPPPGPCCWFQQAFRAG